MANPQNPAVALVDYGGIDMNTLNLTLLAANSARRWATIRNDTDQDIPYAEGWTATASLYTDVIPAGGRLEIVWPASAAAINGYLATTPTGRILTTERLG